MVFNILVFKFYSFLNKKSVTSKKKTPLQDSSRIFGLDGKLGKH